MLILVKVLTIAVTAQPVALVVERPRAAGAASSPSFIQADNESYILRRSPTKERAQRLLDQQRVAAVIEIPKGFDARVARGRRASSTTR